MWQLLCKNFWLFLYTKHGLNISLPSPLRPPETRSVPSLPTSDKHLSPLMFTGGADGNGHLPRPRRPRRGGVGHAGVMVSPQGQVAPGAHPHPAAPPCTDYDVAYFKAYSHIGVHEEMLKVFTPHSSHISSFPPGGWLGGCVPWCVGGVRVLFWFSACAKLWIGFMGSSSSNYGRHLGFLVVGVFVALAYKTTELTAV
jgi:hypothetical protein